MFYCVTPAYSNFLVTCKKEIVLIVLLCIVQFGLLDCVVKTILDCEEHFGQRRKEHSGLRVVKNILGYLELRIVQTMYRQCIVETILNCVLYRTFWIAQYPIPDKECIVASAASCHN